MSAFHSLLINPRTSPWQPSPSIYHFLALEILHCLRLHHPLLPRCVACSLCSELESFLELPLARPDIYAPFLALYRMKPPQYIDRNGSPQRLLLQNRLPFTVLNPKNPFFMVWEGINVAKRSGGGSWGKWKTLFSVRFCIRYRLLCLFYSGNMLLMIELYTSAKLLCISCA